MRTEYALALSILILLIGAVGADSLSSVIMVDGAAWVSSSVLDQEQTYTGRLFTTDLAVLMRDLVIDKTVTSRHRQMSDQQGRLESMSTRLRYPTRPMREKRASLTE